MSNDFDVLVVGSGAGGGMAALRLCEAGVKVGLLERGPRFDPSKDYILNHTDWELRYDPLDRARTQEQSIDLRYRAPESQRSSFAYHRVHGVGGSTLHYQGEAHRFARHAFDGKTRFGWGVDWPINYDDLAPYYAEAEGLLGVAGEAGNPFKPAREEFPCAAHALSERSQILRSAATQAGMTLLPNTLALPSKSIDGRLPCQHSGGCNYGCIFKAKSSIDQAIIPKAEATGNLTLLADTHVLRLEFDADGEINGLVCRQGQSSQTLTAQRYILAGGAVETPRLMLSSAASTHAQGFGNQFDQVGRYFMETVSSLLPLRLAANMQTHRGPPLDSRIWDFALPADQQTSGFVLGSAGYLYPGIGPIRHAVATPGIGRAHKQKVRTSFGRDLYLFGVAEQVPDPANRLTLSTLTDEVGVPRVQVRCEYTAQDHHTIKIMGEKLSAWAQAVPTTAIGRLRSTRYQAAATHVGGTCRMGNDPQHSVVDAQGKIHGQQRGYIADASVLPTQGAGDSPSLTIQALALRTADAVIADLKQTQLATHTAT